MARSADAATVVLDSLEVLYGLSADGDVRGDAEVMAALESVGVSGFNQNHAGTVRGRNGDAREGATRK